MTIAVMDYSVGCIFMHHTNDSIEDIDNYVYEELGYKYDEIQYMVSEDNISVVYE